jgi:hypothetical protein
LKFIYVLKVQEYCFVKNYGGRGARGGAVGWGTALPCTAVRVPDGWGSQISRQSSHEGSKVVSPTHRPPLPPGNLPYTHFY